MPGEGYWVREDEQLAKEAAVELPLPVEAVMPGRLEVWKESCCLRVHHQDASYSAVLSESFDL